MRYTFVHPEIKTHLLLLLKLSGDKLFQYIADDNTIHRVSDMDLNQYIQQYMGEQFTVKDFRTYAANYHFISALLREIRKHSNNLKKNITNAIKISARHLGHTKNISKKSYVMAYCISLYLKDPVFFIRRKFDPTINVLTDVLRNYKKSIYE